MTMMMRGVVLSILSSLEVYGETKRAATHRRLAAPSTQIQPRHVSGHRLNSNKAREFPEQAQCQKKKGWPGTGSPSCCQQTGKGGLSQTDSTKITRTKAIAFPG